MIKKIAVVGFVCFFTNFVFAQEVKNLITYKQVDTTTLKMEVIYPPDLVKSKIYPAVVFFFGGGWISGSINQFKPQANFFAKRGMVCFLVDYRVKNRQKITPFESLKDAKSAMRFVRKNARDFQVNPNAIIASGGSAGGHLAAATALIDNYNETTDDLSISAKPNALILFNPVIDNGPDGYGYERVGDAYKNFSPLYNIRKNAPPTIVFQGTKDKLIPVATAERFKNEMIKAGNQCELFLYDGQEHGFFNKKEFVDKTMVETDKFLTQLGYLKPL
ncbi:alpha/beta hydrolase [Pedobacter arcticus]|uniref:alpha/beta hydrolase n=1 Tax=Pedobacter arcticus TaxID=752140 RepID=UPI0002EBB750|nr:alpha/beta hydrolase [Pedobacter arcticus]